MRYKDQITIRFTTYAFLRKKKTSKDQIIVPNYFTEHYIFRAEQFHGGIILILDWTFGTFHVSNLDCRRKLKIDNEMSC